MDGLGRLTNGKAMSDLPEGGGLRGGIDDG
jgi:hypothetical protein